MPADGDPPLPPTPHGCARLRPSECAEAVLAPFDHGRSRKSTRGSHEWPARTPIRPRAALVATPSLREASPHQHLNTLAALRRLQSFFRITSCKASISISRSACCSVNRLFFIGSPPCSVPLTLYFTVVQFQGCTPLTLRLGPELWPIAESVERSRTAERYSSLLDIANVSFATIHRNAGLPV